MTGLVMKYFVLKPKGDDVYASASRGAMRQYAKLIQLENPELSVQLREWADRETNAAAELKLAANNAVQSDSASD